MWYSLYAMKKRKVAGELGARLAARRRELRIKQSELAAQVGVHSGQVSVWERGVRKPHPRSRKLLAYYLDVSLDWLEGVGGDADVKMPDREALAHDRTPDPTPAVAHIIQLPDAPLPGLTDTLSSTILKCSYCDNKIELKGRKKTE